MAEAETEAVQDELSLLNNNNDQKADEQTNNIPQLELTDEELCSKINCTVFEFLKNLIEANLTKRTNETISSDVQLYVALKFLTSGKCDPCEKDSVDVCITNVVNSLIEIAPQFIKFPTEFLEIQKQFYSFGKRSDKATGFPNVIGIIDCMHIQLQAPSDNPDQYINDHSQHSINVQLVCGPNLQIYNVFAAFPCSKTDSYVWLNSNLCHILTNSGLSDCWLIGDSKYLQEPWLMTPVSTPETPAEELYNCIHAITWKLIERCVGILKSRFECLQNILDYDPQRVSAIIVACCVLHNICLQYEDVDIDINLKETPSMINNGSNNSDKEVNLEEGVATRNKLIKNSFIP